MAKRIVAMLIAISIAAFALTGCSGKANDETTTSPAVIEKEA